jgi:SAM-dependent methyltransferase
VKERVFRFRAVEKRIAASRPGFRALDIGCGRGDNLRRLVRYGAQARGIEPDLERARQAQGIAPVAVAVGEHVPLESETFDMVYISHVLHHARDLPRVLAESQRLLAPGGLLFVIETIDDSPLMRLARALQPSWEDDEVMNRFRYADLVRAFELAGFEMLRGEKFNALYFAWELLPMKIRALEFFTPVFIGIETLLHRLIGRRWGGHCFLVARKPGSPRFGDEGTPTRA